MMTLDQNSSKTINFSIFQIDFFKLFDPMKTMTNVILMPKILAAIDSGLLKVNVSSRDIVQSAPNNSNETYTLYVPGQSGQIQYNWGKDPFEAFKSKYKNFKCFFFSSQIQLKWLDGHKDNRLSSLYLTYLIIHHPLELV